MMYATVLPRSKRVQNTIDDVLPAVDKTFTDDDKDIMVNNHVNIAPLANTLETDETGANEDCDEETESSRLLGTRHCKSNANNLTRILPSNHTLSSIPEAEEQHATMDNIDLEIRRKIRREFALLQSVRKSKLLNSSQKSNRKSSKNGSVPAKFQLPPVCGRSPPCDCPEDQLYASKLRLRILKKISTLRKRHLKLRVILLRV